tara:strand:+ start:305 stop:817 length:513 start_codon:yes stop_codon:yes gene_type:complete
MPKLLVLGCADTVWRDAEAAMQMAEFDAVLAVNHMIRDWPGRLDYAASLHPEHIEGWMKDRRGTESAPPAKWGHSGTRVRGLDGIIRDWGGSSGLFGCQIGMAEGFDRIVVAGVPLTSTPHYHAGYSFAAPQYRKGWKDHVEDIRPFVRSMSGWTKSLLGRPTKEWMEAC